MRTFVFTLTALLLISGVAFADTELRKLESSTPVTGATSSRADCITDDYDCYMEIATYEVPDFSSAGILLGPIPTDPGGTIQDVILFINMEHTWIGDLVIELGYDPDCTDGIPYDGTVLDRPGVPESTFGCSGNFVDWYGFDDTAASIEDICPAEFIPGCYGPDYDSSGLDGFDGLATGGCFWLFISDNAGGDLGTVYAWEVCLLTDSVTPTGGALDIKPESCPNPFNLKAQGKLPVAVLSTDDFDATYIDVATLSLECPDGSAEPIWYRIGDVATPVGPDAEPCECTEEGPDGYMDLKLKFLRQDIVAVLGPVDDGDEVELTLTGTMMDGTPFSVSDCIEILKRGKLFTVAPDGAASAVEQQREGPEETTWSTIKALYR